MTAAEVKAGLEFIAAGTAFAAAVCWYAAARCPVAKYTPAVYGDISDEVKPLNDKIQRGAVLSARAAMLAASSAVAQGIALAIPHFWP